MKTPRGDGSAWRGSGGTHAHAHAERERGGERESVERDGVSVFFLLVLSAKMLQSLHSEHPFSDWLLEGAQGSH